MSTRSDYISDIASDAIRSTRGTGLFPSVMIAQAAIESGNGTSYLSRTANNHFGIKCHSSWSGQSVRATDDAPNECFRKYSSRLASFKDRNKFLKENKRYTSAGVFSAKTPQAQADALQKAGYATASNYAATIKSVIKTYDLEKYDQQTQLAGFFSPVNMKLLPERIILIVIIIAIIYIVKKLFISLK